MDEDATKVEGVRASSARTSGRRTGTRYRVGDRIGRGGMGEVLDAHDEQFDRSVALKRMRAEAPTEDQMQRFLREARIQGQLEHPSIVPIHELGRDLDGRPYFVMKKLAGQTLSEILAAADRTAYPLQRLLRAFVDVCLAIEFAHTRGVIHRDIKPGNIMLGDFGETYVLDWGIAKIVGEVEEAVSLNAPSVETVTGAAVGTPGYMSPEQARGEAGVDARSDVYALGCVLFEILSGERLHPKGAAGLATTVAGIDARLSLRAPDRDIAPELDQLCVMATALDRADRIQTARMLADGVQRFLDGDRDLAQRQTLAVEHLDRAIAAFACDDRTTSMREAGRALALDPTLHRAGELITRLLIEPPAITPPEVERALEEEQAMLTRRNAHYGMVATLSLLLLLPVFALAGSVDLTFWLAIPATTATIVFALWRISRPGARFVRFPLVVLAMILLVLCGRLFSPFLLGIPIAAVAIVALLAGHYVRLPEALGYASLLAGAVLVPWGAELLGVLTPTLAIDHGVLALRSPVFHDPLATASLLCAATIVVVIMAALMVHGIRTTDQAARKRLHLVSWQLRQLVTS